MLSNDDGIVLVKLARETIEKYFETGKFEIRETKFNKKQGVFVSLHTYPDYQLKGCIGYVEPVYPLGEALQRATFSAAFEDFRFKPLRKEELGNTVFEVSILTEPEIIKVDNPKEYPKKIEIGKDGLIVKTNDKGGLLLPQVPLQFKPAWDPDTFLEHVCMKAGLMPDMWLDNQTKIYKFQCQIFKEQSPKGKIIQT